MKDPKATKRMLGTVLTVLKDKGYGFIDVAGEDHDVFFHLSAAPDGIQPGDDVSFIPMESDKGLRALAVRREGK